MQKWNLLVHHDVPGAFHMALDEVLMNQVRTNASLPVLRFYTWKPACLSLGYFQKAEQEIDMDACRRQNIDVVRRATGGRAVLHDEELTYSIIVREDNTLIPSSITQSYRQFSEGLVRGFDQLGIPAHLSGEETLRVKDFRSSACFEAPSSYEVVVHGKKIVGSAQVRKEGVLLQHGSIINKLDADLLFSLFNVHDEKKLAVMKRFLLDKATSVEEVCGKILSQESLIDAFSSGISDALGLDLIKRKLTLEEEEMTRHLMKTKYGHPSWTFRL